MSQKPMMKNPASTGPSNRLSTLSTPITKAVPVFNDFSKLRFFAEKRSIRPRFFAPRRHASVRTGHPFRLCITDMPAGFPGDADNFRELHASHLLPIFVRRPEVRPSPENTCHT